MEPGDYFIVQVRKLTYLALVAASLKLVSSDFFHIVLLVFLIFYNLNTIFIFYFFRHIHFFVNFQKKGTVKNYFFTVPFQIFIILFPFFPHFRFIAYSCLFSISLSTSTLTAETCIPFEASFFQPSPGIGKE